MRTDSDDAILLCPERSAIVAPNQRTENTPFSCAAALWPKAPGSSGKGAALYTIECYWDTGGALQPVRHIRFDPQADGVLTYQACLAVVVGIAAIAVALLLYKG